LMLRETRGALVASGAADGDASFEATAAISLPRACRPVPPRSSAKTADAPADLASMAVGFASALAFGRAIPPAPPTEDGLTAPAAWHPSRPVLATVDGEGQVLIHHDPARRSKGTPADANQTHQTSPENATTTALRHASHARARALAWRPRAGATLAVAGGDGVCLWSKDPGASGAVGDASSACGDVKKGGSKSAPNQTRQPPWRFRFLPDERDDASTVATEDPFRAAGVSTFFSFADAVIAVSENVRVAVAALISAIASPGKTDETRNSATRRKSRLFRSLLGGLSSARVGSSDRVDSKPLPYDTCAWSPDGRLLVAGSKDRSGISVWEIATGKRTAVASDARGVASVTFSRCGEYLLAAHARSGFTVWETEGWRSAHWGTEGRAVTAVAWGPRGGAVSPGPGEKNSPGSEAPPRGATALVAAEGGGARLVAAHFSRGAPSLAAQVLPVDLPRAVTAVRNGGDGNRETTDGKLSANDGASASPDVAHMSWDPSGRRLAVAFADSSGSRESEKIGLFATRLAPVTRASLIGYVAAESVADASREAGRGGAFGNAGPARVALLSGPGGAAGCRAPGDDAEATTTLAACWEGGGVSFVPVFA
jgi:aladin